jgi:putative endonuclease
MLGIVLNKRKLLADRTLLGQWGEKHCQRFLKKKGLKKLTRNFYCRAGEIDLIMVDRDKTIVFVEVKTEASITSGKKARLLRTAQYFLAVNNIENRPFRFDVVTIVLSGTGRPLLIRHYKNAFVP